MYGVIGIFDEKTEQVIKEIWSELKEMSISFYAYEVENRRPHITLASYIELNESEYIKRMDEIYEDKRAINIAFNTIGSFLKSGTLFLSPTVTKELTELHSNHHRYFEKFNDNPSSQYLPGSWVPHCTIANRLSTEKISEAFKYCLNRNDIIYGKIQEIAIIDTSYSGKAPIIYSKKLSA